MTPPQLTAMEVEKGLKSLEGWCLEPPQQGIQKNWDFDCFKSAMAFFQSVGEIAERLDHHPEFVSQYTRAQIRLVTHDAGGLTAKDLELAAAIDQLIRNDFSEALKTKST